MTTSTTTVTAVFYLRKREVVVMGTRGVSAQSVPWHKGVAH